MSLPHLVDGEVGVRADDLAAAEVHTLTTSPYPLPSTLYLRYVPTHLVNGKVGVRADDRAAAEVHTLTTSPYPLSSTLDIYIYIYICSYPPG